MVLNGLSQANAGPRAHASYAAESLVHRLLDDRYVLRAVLGRGTFGAVYRAIDRRSGEALAVKVLIEATDPTTLACFLKEAAALGAVRHPNVVAIRGQGRDAELGLPYVAMELVEGPELGRLLAARLARGEGPFPPAAVFDLGEAVLRGLAHIHKHGVVHGDLKPSNVLMGRVPKLIDFGLAVLTKARQAAGTVAGTPAYMAPEVTLGAPASVSADLYSFGCSVYELLAGRPPFTGETPEEIMARQRAEQPVPLRALGLEVPAALDEVVLALLAKEPAGRPKSASDAYWAFRGAGSGRTRGDARAESDYSTV